MGYKGSWRRPSSGVVSEKQIQENHDELQKIPVFMLTTMTDPKVVAICNKLGCEEYISKERKSK